MLSDKTRYIQIQITTHTTHTNNIAIPQLKKKTLLPKPVGKVDSFILKMKVFVYKMTATWLKLITYNVLLQIGIISNCYCYINKLLSLMLTGSRSGIISSFSHKMYLASSFQMTWKRSCWNKELYSWFSLNSPVIRWLFTFAYNTTRF